MKNLSWFVIPFFLLAAGLFILTFESTEPYVTISEDGEVISESTMFEELSVLVTDLFTASSAEAHTRCGRECARAGFSARGCHHHDSSGANSCVVPGRQVSFFDGLFGGEELTHPNECPDTGLGCHHGVRDAGRMSGSGREISACALLDACSPGGHGDVPGNHLACIVQCSSSDNGFCNTGSSNAPLSGCEELCLDCLNL